MRHITPTVAGVALAAVVLATVLTISCGGSSPQPGKSSALGSAMPRRCTEGGPLVFVVSGREDSPAPALTGAMSTAAWTAIQQGSPIGLVDLDGKPRLTLAGAFSDPGVNHRALASDEQTYLAELTYAVENTRAEFPHADVLDALEVAGRAAYAGCSYGGTIYFEDSGLQETGPLNFGRPGLLSASPADVVAFLKAEGELPQLRGLKVVFVGLGDTAQPQPPLSIDQTANVTAIWTAVAKAGGAASVVTDPAPRNGIAAPPYVPPVMLVPVPAEPAWNSGYRTFVFPDSGPLGFEPNTTVFRDPAKALAALRPLARYLAANPAARIELTGTTADWGSYTGDIVLSLQRADAVKAVLVRLGASSDQIATRGLGWRFPGYENDQGPGGTLLPGPAEHNRSVIVTQLPR